MINDHPIFSGTENTHWVSFEEINESNTSQLRQILEEERTNIIEYAETIFRKFIQENHIGKGEWEILSFLVKPMENEQNGFVTYLEFIFPASEAHDSDSWWIIIGCPDSTKKITPTIRFYPWSFGWFCQ